MKRYWNVCFDIATICYVTIRDPNVLVPFKGGLEMSNSQPRKWSSFNKKNSGTLKDNPGEGNPFLGTWKLWTLQLFIEMSNEKKRIGWVLYYPGI